MRLFGFGIETYDNLSSLMFYSIGQYSLAIYLLQYFFIPGFANFPSVVSRLDEVTVYMVSIAITVIITAACMCFISLLGNSKYVMKCFFGQK